MTNVVLVHGAWHGGWCWRRVADRLVRKGHRVFAPTLTGLADRSHLLSEAVNLDTHIDDIVNLLRWEDLQDVVLCGHSYAGLVITGVAEKAAARLAALVYVDAYVPKDGDSAQSLSGGPGPPAPTVPPPPVSVLRLRQPGDAVWVEAKMTPQPGESSRQELRVTGAYRGVPRKGFLLANKAFGPEDAPVPIPVFESAYEAVKDDPAWIAAKLDGGHDLMLDCPEEVADFLESFC